MNFYAYQVVDVDGKLVTGAVQAESADVARQDLAVKGFYVINVRQSSNLLGALAKSISSRRVSRVEIIEFANNLSVMLKAGVPILVALQDIITTSDNKVLQQTLRAIKHDVEMGSRFSDAIAAKGEFFPDILVRLVRVGEETGDLEKSLSDIAGHLQKMHELAASIKRALIYPSFAIVTTFGALVFWLMFVLPKIVDTIKGMGVKLPLLTRILVAASHFAKQYWMFMPVAMGLVIVIYLYASKSERFRYQRDRLLLKLPIVKLVVYNKLVALFAEQMRILVVAGLTIDRSLDLIANVIGNEVFRRALLKTREMVMQGGQISESLQQHNLFPLLVIRMVYIGESSGTLDQQFDFLSRHYLDKLDNVSENLGKIIEPAVIAVVGLLFVVIILGLMLPIYDMVSAVGKG